MKTILYNPIFINPQAYYVFPNLNGQLVEQKDVTIEPAKYSGTIEVKVIANGDSKLIRYYSNTNKIDLSEFKDSWIDGVHPSLAGHQKIFECYQREMAELFNE